MQLLDWRPTVWLGCAAVLALAPELPLMLLRVQTLEAVPELGARPLLGLMRPGLFRLVLSRWPVRSGGVWLVE